MLPLSLFFFWATPPPFYEFRVPSISPHPSCYFLPSQFQSLSMTTQILPPPLTSLSSVRVSPRASRPAATTHDLLILLAATGLPSPSHNTNMQNILHPHAHTHSRTPTHQHGHNSHTTWFATNREGPTMHSEVHNSILTFSEVWDHSTKIKPHLFSAVRHNVFLALTWNTSERSVEHKSFTFGCQNYCKNRRLDDIWCLQCFCNSLELVRTHDCPILMINETKIFRPHDI